MISKFNFYLLNLLITLSGTIFFIINVKELLVIPGLLLISVLFMITPAIINALNFDINKFCKIQSLSLIIIPLIFLCYIYTIKISLPVGYQDVHANIFEYTRIFSENGKILFSYAQNLSFNFVGLYIVFHFLDEITQINIIGLASIIPPFFTMILILAAYMIVNRLHSHKIALIAAFLFGWEGQVILFGQEMRTQTMGILLLFLLIAFVLIIQKSPHKNQLSSKIIIMLFLFGIVTASFVSIFFTVIVLLIMLTTVMVFPILLKWPVKSLSLTWELFILFFIFIFFYLLYIGSGFQSIISEIILLYKETIIKTAAPSSSIFGGQPIAGIFAMYINYIFLSIFLFFSIFYIIYTIKRKDLGNAVILAGFGFLLIFWFVDAFISPLSPDRIYVVSFFLMASIVSFGFFELQRISKEKKIKYSVKIFAYVILVLFALSSVAQFPNYVIGETNPIRSIEPIDTIPYWSADSPQYRVVGFLYDYSSKNMSIHPHMLIINYYFFQQLITKKGFKIINSLDFSIGLRPEVIKKNDIIILQDRFKGGNYTYRDLLPKPEFYENFNKIYSNSDYVVYIV